MSFFKTAKNIIIGKAKDPQDKQTFHHLSLIAWGADLYRPFVFQRDKARPS
jgi:hypothetical protein